MNAKQLVVACAALVGGSAHAQSTCLGIVTDLSVEFGGPEWQTFGTAWSFGGNGSGLVYTDCVVEAPPGEAVTIDSRISFFAGIGVAGFVVGYEPGDHASSGPDYLALLRSGLGNSPWRLYRVDAPLLANGVPAGSELLAESGANPDQTHDATIELSVDRLLVQDGGTTVFDLTGDYSTYLGGNSRFGFVSFQQPTNFDLPEFSLPEAIPACQGLSGSYSLEFGSWNLSSSATFLPPGNGIVYTNCSFSASSGTSISVHFPILFGFPRVGSGGYLLGYEPGEATAVEPDYLALITDAADDSPMFVYRITEPLSPSGEFQNPELLHVSSDDHPPGLTEFVIIFDANELTVIQRVGSQWETLVDLTGEFSSYVSSSRIGLVSFGQSMTWTTPRFETLVNVEAELGGLGCQGSNGVPTMSFVSAPIPSPSIISEVEPNLVLSIDNLPLSIVSAAFGMIGRPLPTGPIDLSVVGASGCSLHLRADVFVPLTPTAGSATWTIEVPPLMPLIGQDYLFQTGQLDLLANPLGLTTSNSASLRIGGSE